jgi:hypothetical protein
VPRTNPLLRLRATSNNAAMQADVPNSDLPKLKRRWFQFSLRSLIIAVTLLALLSGYVVRQRAFVTERQQFLDDSARYVAYDDNGPEVPWVRRLLGDRAILEIDLDLASDKGERQQIAALFPEAQIRTAWLEHVTGGGLNEYTMKFGRFSDEAAMPSQSRPPSRP